MDYKQLGRTLLDYVGNEENIKSASYNSTRIHLEVNDLDAANPNKMETLIGVRKIFVEDHHLIIIIREDGVANVFEGLTEGKNIHKPLRLEKQFADISIEDIPKDAELKKNQIIIFAPVEGKILNQKIDNGVSIEVDSGLIASPFNGILTEVDAQKLSVKVQSYSGVDVLIQFTNGNEATKVEVYKEVGDRVEKGESILEVKDNKTNLIASIFVKSTKDFHDLRLLEKNHTEFKEDLFSIQKMVGGVLHVT